MDIRSYLGKEFTVLSNLAFVRDPNNLSNILRYAPGDNIPEGKNIGDRVVIPKLTDVRVTDTRVDLSRNVFVLVEPSEAGVSPSGWTSAGNLRGQFMNETIGTSPAEWILLPQGNNFTVVDKTALIRGGAPGFASTSGTIPRGALVIVTEKSHTNPQGKFVRVSQGRLEQDQIVVGDEIGWTAAINLAPGWSDEYRADSYADTQGPNAAWRGGVYLGQIALVNIVGTGGQAEQVTLGSLDAYLKLRQVVEENDNIAISIESGFRSFPRQKFLFDNQHKPGFNRAAPPGHSDHQHGQAFDLNTERKGFDNDPVYRALRKNGPPNGFIRTVSGEPWHWEYLPEEATQLAQAGKFKRAGIDP